MLGKVARIPLHLVGVLAMVVLLGAGCGSPTPADLEGTWIVDPTTDGADAFQEATYEFTGDELVMSIDVLDAKATMDAAYRVVGVGADGDQPDADLALAFDEFTLRRDGEETVLAEDDVPFSTVHIAFGDNHDQLTLFDKHLDDTDSAIRFIRQEE